MSPGMMDFYDNMITPTEPGMQELVILISYQDDTGESIEERKVYNLNVYEMDFGGGGGIDFYPPMGDDWVWDDSLQTWVPPSQGLRLWVKIAIAAGAVIIAGATVVVILRVRKKKRNRIADDEAE